MARMSKAKKARMKMEREGHVNPSESHYRNVGLSVRVTKDKTAYTRKGRNSSGATHQMDSDLSIFFMPFSFRKENQ